MIFIICGLCSFIFFFSSRRRHTRFKCDWSSDVCSSDLRYGYEFSLVFLDLDHFKAVNDTHGHLTGSKLLAEIGQVLRDNCRLIDFAFRYGGDEFVILLPQTSKENACVGARRLHKLIRDSHWLTSEGTAVRITPP